MYYLGVPGNTSQNPYAGGVEIGPNSNIQGGLVGSYTLIKSKGSLLRNGNMYSGGTMQLSFHNTITGNISVANSKGIAGTVFSAGACAKITGDINANGNIAIISGGRYRGKLPIRQAQLIHGPLPGGGNIIASPVFPVLPVMPAITNLSISRINKYKFYQDDYAGSLW